MQQSFGFIDLLVSPVFAAAMVILFLGCLVFLFRHKGASTQNKTPVVLLLVFSGLSLLFFVFWAVMWGQPPAAPPTPAFN